MTLLAPLAGYIPLTALHCVGGSWPPTWRSASNMAHHRDFSCGIVFFREAMSNSYRAALIFVLEPSVSGRTTSGCLQCGFRARVRTWRAVPLHPVCIALQRFRRTPYARCGVWRSPTSRALSQLWGRQRQAQNPEAALAADAGHPAANALRIWAQCM